MLKFIINVIVVLLIAAISEANLLAGLSATIAYLALVCYMSQTDREFFTNTLIHTELAKPFMGSKVYGFTEEQYTAMFSDAALAKYSEDDHTLQYSLRLVIKNMDVLSPNERLWTVLAATGWPKDRAITTCNSNEVAKRLVMQGLRIAV